MAGRGLFTYGCPAGDVYEGDFLDDKKVPVDPERDPAVPWHQRPRPWDAHGKLSDRSRWVTAWSM